MLKIILIIHLIISVMIGMGGVIFSNKVNIKGLKKYIPGFIITAIYLLGFIVGYFYKGGN